MGKWHFGGRYSLYIYRNINSLNGDFAECKTALSHSTYCISFLFLRFPSQSSLNLVFGKREARKEKVDRIDSGKRKGRNGEMALWGSLYGNLNGLNGDIAESERAFCHSTFLASPFEQDLFAENMILYRMCREAIKSVTKLKH